MNTKTKTPIDKSTVPPKMPITIAVVRGGALVMPAVPELINFLAVPWTIWTADGPTGYQAKAGVFRFAREADGSIFIPVGTVAEVAAELRRMGRQVRIVDKRRITDYAQPADDVVARLSDQDLQFAELIARTPCGLIEVTGDRERFNRLALLMRMFPVRRRVIVAAS